MNKRDIVAEETLEYYQGDELATNVWMTKYCLKDNSGNLMDSDVLNAIQIEPILRQSGLRFSLGPWITDNDIERRHLDLRPFVLSGKTSYVTTGGLTRVALRKGSTIVNSSQGGGSKDTLIVD